MVYTFSFSKKFSISSIPGLDFCLQDSYNDCAEIRELYDGFHVFDFTRVHSMAQRYEAGKEFKELLIGNYDLFEREKSKPTQMKFEI